MKPRLLPLYFEPGVDEGFGRQLEALAPLVGERVEILPPAPLGSELPECEAVLFPQLLGEAYRRLADFQALDRPIVILTSEFGTLSMWDWEIMAYLRAEGVETIAPYNLAQTHMVCDALRARREIRAAAMLVYQDNPGKGAQAPIFKRFYWWEDECSRRMEEQFGVRVVRKSLKELGARAAAVSDSAADEAWRRRTAPVDGLSPRQIRSAMKLYLAVKEDLAADPAIRAVGMNCLNESHFLDATPCLAWDVLFREEGYLWGCEGDTVSMLTELVLHRALAAPLMMTNLYPFLLGDAALKHERIAAFPAVDRPDDCLLVAHCGYLGVVPQTFATQWTLRPKVLAIVDENATAIDARLPEGDVTLAKLLPTMGALSVAEGRLEGYAQYPASDCRNGAVLRVGDGRRLMDSLCSHHAILLTGHRAEEIRLVAKVFGLGVEEV